MGRAKSKREMARGSGATAKAAAAPSLQRGGDTTAEPGDWPEQLAVRIAWNYYVIGQTQQAIATALGLNRVRVNRILAEARQRGIVRITIDSPLRQNVELEDRLKHRYGLRDARVVLGSGGTGPSVDEVLGMVACDTLVKRFADGMTIGVGWGVTLKAFAESMPETPLRDAAVVAMLGSLTQRSSIDIFEATTGLARKLGAECFYMPGPIICDSKASRDTLMRQPMLRDVQARARGADIAIVSVGGIDRGTLRRVGFIGEDDVALVRRAGAIGNFLGYYIDAGARIVDHPVNRRVLGMHPDDLARVPERWMISGGPDKVAALAAILGAGLVTGIVTDQDTARALL